MFITSIVVITNISLRNVFVYSMHLLFETSFVRVLALIVKLISISSAVAFLVSQTDLLCILEAEVRNVKDTISALKVFNACSNPRSCLTIVEQRCC